MFFIHHNNITITFLHIILAMSVRTAVLFSGTDDSTVSGFLAGMTPVIEAWDFRLRRTDGSTVSGFLAGMTPVIEAWHFRLGRFFSAPHIQEGRNVTLGVG